MLIKNAEKLKRKHPNYSEEIVIIKHLVDDCVTVLNTDLLQLAQSIDSVDWDIKIKKFFLSDQPKEILCNDPSINDGKLHGFSMLFMKDSDAPISVIISHQALINRITDSQIFDRMAVNGVIMEISFEKTGEYSGMFSLESQNGSPVLKSYEINFNK